MNEPLVSVIVTTYNGSDSIGRAVESVKKQTYKNIEIIVVDDNGVGTEEQIATEKIVRQFSDVTYIPHQENKNGSAARNTGASAAKGDFFCFLDDDDEFMEEKVALQVAKFNELGDDYAIVYCSYININQNNVKKTFIADKRGDILIYSLLDQIKVATSLFMIRRTAFEDMHGFDESFRRHQDWEFVARVSNKYKADFVPDICVVKHSISRNSAKNLMMMEKYRNHYLNKLKPIIDNTDRSKEIYCYHYLCFVKEYVKKGQIGKFFEYLVKSKAPLLYTKMFLESVLKSCTK